MAEEDGCITYRKGLSNLDRLLADYSWAQLGRENLSCLLIARMVRRTFLNKHRDELQIIRDALLVVCSGKRSKKTHIMYGANLSYRLLTCYLRVIMNAGLLEHGEESFTITEKGRMFLESYESYERNCKDLEKNLKGLKDEKEYLKRMLMS